MGKGKREKKPKQINFSKMTTDDLIKLAKNMTKSEPMPSYNEFSIYLFVLPIVAIVGYSLYPKREVPIINPPRNSTEIFSTNADKLFPIPPSVIYGVCVLSAGFFALQFTKDAVSAITLALFFVLDYQAAAYLNASLSYACMMLFGMCSYLTIRVTFECKLFSSFYFIQTFGSFMFFAICACVRPESISIAISVLILYYLTSMAFILSIEKGKPITKYYFIMGGFLLMAGLLTFCSFISLQTLLGRYLVQPYPFSIAKIKHSFIKNENLGTYAAAAFSLILIFVAKDMHFQQYSFLGTNIIGALFAFFDPLEVRNNAMKTKFFMVKFHLFIIATVIIGGQQGTTRKRILSFALMSFIITGLVFQLMMLK